VKSTCDDAIVSDDGNVQLGEKSVTVQFVVVVVVVAAVFVGMMQLIAERLDKSSHIGLIAVAVHHWSCNESPRR